MKRIVLLLTQVRLAREFGLLQSPVSQMLSCKMLMSTKMVTEIGSVLCVSPTDATGGPPQDNRGSHPHQDFHGQRHAKQTHGIITMPFTRKAQR